MVPAVLSVLIENTRSVFYAISFRTQTRLRKSLLTCSYVINSRYIVSHNLDRKETSKTQFDVDFVYGNRRFLMEITQNHGIGS